MKKPGTIHRQIAELLQQHPSGLTMGEIRERLNLPHTAQAQLDRRKRDLKRWYIIEQVRDGKNYRYIFNGTRDIPLPDATVNARLRAQILHAAHGRCGMCGRSIEKHSVTLVVDHKIPQDWGGTDAPDNLWAICEDCNGGKKSLFSSQDQELMRQVMGIKSVHERIATTLKANAGSAVPSHVLEFVSNQADWQKRLRELRYLGWEIESKKTKGEAGKVTSTYVLNTEGAWPENMTKWLRDYERNRAVANKAKNDE